MRFVLRVLASLALFAWAAPAAAQQAAMCEYAHPAHPGWDFYRPCTVTTETRPGAETRRAEVTGGSVFKVETKTTGDGSAITVNGRAAIRMAGEDGSDCWRTAGENETICIHPADRAAPDPGFVPDAGVASAPPVLGGSEGGFCLLKQVADGALALVDHGTCRRAQSCQTETDGSKTCLMLYVWGSGRELGVYSGADGLALDGAPAEAVGENCWQDSGEGQTFCWAKTDWSADQEPVLAGPVQLDEPPPAPAPAPAPPATPSAEPAPEPAPVSGMITGTCRFLKDGEPLAEQPCRAENTCEGTICEIGYTTDSGLRVTLRAEENRVVEIDGAATGPARLSPRGPTCVPWPASPFIFCFVPG